jgi:hypothetical protein
MSKNLFRQPALLTLALAGLAALAIILFYQSQPHQQYFNNDRAALAFLAVTSIFETGATWLFLRSLRTFKPALKTPYILLTIGILLVPLPQFLWVAGFLLRASGAETLINTVFLLAYFLAAPLMYLGIRKFARLVSARSIWCSIRFILALTLGVTTLLALAFLPALAKAQIGLVMEIIAIIIIGGLTLSILCSVAATIVALRIRNTVGTSYRQAMSGLTSALAATLLVFIHEMLNTFNILQDPAYLAFDKWPYALAGLLFLRAGQLFWRSGQAPKQLEANATYLDAVVYVAQLASNTAAINGALNKMRVITAAASNTTGSTQELTAKDKATLMEAYLEIETYLTAQDPLRKYTKEYLRNHYTTYDFQQALATARV